MKCPHCGGANFDWAATCDHCRRALKGEAAEAGAGPMPAAPPAVHRARVVDEEEVRERAFRTALAIATPTFFLTTAIVIVNIVVYGVMVARGVSPTNPSVDALIAWGANKGSLTTHGEWSRLATCAFVHVGFAHLAMNMVALLMCGRLAERLFGQPAFFVIYIAGAIAGSIASMTIHPTVTSAGASGAIFAVYGALIAMLMVCRQSIPELMRSSLLQTYVWFVVYNILYGVLEPRVDIAGHIGGFVMGLAAGAALATPLAPGRVTKPWRLLAATSVAALVLAAAARVAPAFDDLDDALTKWNALQHRVESEHTEAARALDAATLTRDEFADRVEALIPPIRELRSTVGTLHVEPDKRALGGQLTTALTLQEQALAMTASAERSGDENARDRAARKYDEWLQAMLAIMPDNKPLRDVLAQRQREREERTAFRAELVRLDEIERAGASFFADILQQFREGRRSIVDMEQSITQDILQPIERERLVIQSLAVPQELEPARKRITDYMERRADGWRTVADGAGRNDPELMRRGQAMLSEAVDAISVDSAHK